jgi:long-subunit fatty acid transport protein
VRETALHSLVAAALVLIGAGAAFGAESFFTGNPSAEGQGRGGADTALSRHALSFRTNPAGLGLIDGNREDLCGLGLFNKLDFYPGSFSGSQNGDAPAFGGHAGFVFVPSRLTADPLLIWRVRPEKDAPYMQGGFIGHRELTAEVKELPRELVLRVRGIGFRVGEIRVRAEVAADKVTRAYAVPEPDPLPDTPVEKVEVQFQWKQDGRPELAGATVNLKAYGRNRAVLLGKTIGKWMPASLSIPLQRSLRPADIKLTIVSETFMEIKNVVVLRSVRADGKPGVIRTPVDDGALSLTVDRDVSTVIVDSTPATVEGRAGFHPAFEVDDFSLLAEERIRRLSVFYRFGFSGQGRGGEVVLEVDGKPRERASHRQPRVLTLDEERMEALTRSIRRFEEDPFHVGVAVFTDAWLSADYTDTPTRIGVHEAQVRYAMYSASAGLAYKVFDNLSVGICADLYYSRFSNLDTVWAASPGILRGPGGSFGSTGAFYVAQTGNDAVMMQFDTDKLSAFGGGLRGGLIWEVTDRLAFGISGASPSVLGEHEGEAMIDFYDDFEFTGFLGDLQTNISLPYGGIAGFTSEMDVTLGNFRLPPKFGIGAAFRATPKLTLALDLTWIAWTLGGRDYLKLTFTGGNNLDVGTITGGDFVVRIPFKFADQIVVAAGLSAELNEQWTVHAGYRYASNPLDRQDLLPIFPLHLEHHATLGVTLSLLTLQFHIAVTHGFGGVARNTTSSHTSDWDGGRLFARENSLLVGISYRY